MVGYYKVFQIEILTVHLYDWFCLTFFMVRTVLILYSQCEKRSLSIPSTPYILFASTVRCPADAIRSPTATMNMNIMAPSSIYVLLDDLRYSPRRLIAQNVLTKGSACIYFQNKGCGEKANPSLSDCLSIYYLDSISGSITSSLASNELQTISKPTEEACR